MAPNHKGRALRVLAGLGLAAVTSVPLVAYTLEGVSWPAGTPVAPSSTVLQLQLQKNGPAFTTLFDGSTSWNQVLQSAITDWNRSMVVFQLASVNDSTAAVPTTEDHNGSNNLIWGGTLYGETWPAGVVAATTVWVGGAVGGGQIVEADIVFNSLIPWDSYRGPARTAAADLRRVALYQLGNLLGLNLTAPGSQSPAPLMSGYGDTDDLTADDIAGIVYLYGGAPTITTQPAPVSSIQGGSASFSVVASGAGPLTYEWQKNGVSLAGPFATYSFTPGASDVGAAYTVVVSNRYGSVTSNPVAVTLTLAITSQPADQAVVQGGSATLSVTAIGTSPVSYQWFGANNTLIAGATGPTLTISNVQLAQTQPPSSYWVQVSDAAGTLQSRHATLAFSLGVVGQPGNQAFVAGGQAVFTVAATGTSPLFGGPSAVVPDGGGGFWVADGTSLRRIAANGTVSTPVKEINIYPIEGLAVDGAGNLYAAGENSVFKVTPAGAVTTVFQDNDDMLSGVAVDSAGNLFVADPYNEVIRKIASNGSSTVFAGSTGVRGSADGKVGAASFARPMAMTADASGNLYVVDEWNETVRKIAPDGTVATLAGVAGHSSYVDGPGAAARFVDPVGIAIDGSGVLYVTDAGAGAIRRIAPDGSVSTVVRGRAPGFLDGLPGTAEFEKLAGIAAWGGALYVCDSVTIRKVTLAGAVTTYSGIPGVAGSSDGPPVTYQWMFDGVPIPGATAPLLVLDGVQASNIGRYTVVVGNAAGSVASMAGMLDYAPFAITAQPVGQTLAAGSTLRLTVSASPSSGLMYEWFFNGQEVSGDSSPSPGLLLSDVQAYDSGAYTVRITGGGYTVESDPAQVTVVTPPLPAHLVNLSARAYVGTGGDILIAGFVIGGGANSNKNILLRGVGPTLGEFGVTDVLASPFLALDNAAGTTLLRDSIWNGEAWLSNEFDQVGAFPLPPTSADTALSTGLGNGNYTALVSGQGGTSGVALAEIYDADVGGPTNRLLNISARAHVGTGDDVLIAGFVIGGTGTENVLIRGVGPTMSQFSISDPLAHPRITVFDATGKAIASNTVWGGDATLAAVFDKVGAFALPANSADSALVISLPAGPYTVELDGSDGGTGVGLIEVYEVP